MLTTKNGFMKIKEIKVNYCLNYYLSFQMEYVIVANAVLKGITIASYLNPVNIATFVSIYVAPVVCVYKGYQSCTTRTSDDDD